MSALWRARVGGGTCGLAAGAKGVLDSLIRSWPDHDVVMVGCRGMCHREVVVEFTHPEKGRWVFGDVNEKKLVAILSFLESGGPCPDKHIIEQESAGESRLSPYWRSQTRVALRNAGEIDPESIGEYENRRGYQALKHVLTQGVTPEGVIEEVATSGLRGRGGAGFSTAQKWRFARAVSSDTKYIICNGDEGDPGAFMDRSVLEGDPHSVIEGMALAAYAIGANKGIAYIRAEYPLAVANFEKAIRDAESRGHVGDRVYGSAFSFHIKVKQGAGAFVCGEETAMMASIEGRRGMPRRRPPFPAQSGVHGYPTIINNVETLANVPWIVLNGGASYAKLGNERARGTKVFALAGAIARGGLVEVPMGVSIDHVLNEIGGGTKSGLPFKAVQMGGPSGGCIPASLFHTPIEYEALNATGAIMGSGGMIALDDTTCMVDLARYFLDFTQRESCGKCTFCRIGTLRMKEILERICNGDGRDDDIPQLEMLAEQIRSTSLCGLGQTAPNPVLTTLRYFRHEYEEHIREKRCRAKVCKKLIAHSIISKACVACGMCTKACPVNAIQGTVKVKGSFSIDANTCINCGMCREACKFSAIEVK